jgi:hypothetical protein
MEFKVWLAGNALSGDVIPAAQGSHKVRWSPRGKGIFFGVERSLTMRKPKVDLEMAQFQADLLQSVRDMKAGTFARSTQVPVTEALQARAKMALSQSQVAKLLAVSVHTLLCVAVQTPRASLSLA